MPKRTLHINASAKSIPVIIDSNLWQDVRDFITNKFPDNAIYLVTETNLANIYADEIKEELSQLPNYKDMVLFIAGEENKNRLNKALIEDAMFEDRAGRDSLIIAFGGGVCGDMAGFVAATMQRGIPLIHMPTSLLAQVDSSIGGKVGVNSKYGKNLLGAFYQPEAIFTDISFLSTLPEIEFRNGLAEVIKYGAILDDEILSLLETADIEILQSDKTRLLEMIERCVLAKIKVVEQDEKESNYRSILNFGHTFGHAVENLSQYNIKHGFAVGAGMVVAAKLSQLLCGFPAADYARLLALISKYELAPREAFQFDFNDIWKSIQMDKKAQKNLPRFTLLKKIADCELFCHVEKEAIQNALHTV